MVSKMYQKIGDRSLKAAIIIGLEYIGVPTVVAFTEKGFSVVGVCR